MRHAFGFAIISAENRWVRIASSARSFDYSRIDRSNAR
jgi:hypothetical protein